MTIARLPGEIQPKRCSVKVRSIRTLQMNSSSFRLVQAWWLLDRTVESGTDALDEQDL